MSWWQCIQVPNFEEGKKQTRKRLAVFESNQKNKTSTKKYFFCPFFMTFP
jgi:hypothetical protein